MRRFFTEPENIRPERALIKIKEDAAHISKVLRMGPGDRVLVFDGTGREFEAEIARVAEDGIEAKILSERKSEYEPKVRVTLFQGIPKAGKLETIVQKAVELGAARIVPYRADRSVAKIPSGEKGRQKTERLNKIAREAAKQCGRGIIPKVSDAVSLSEMKEIIGGIDGVIMLCEELGHKGRRNLREILARGFETVGIIIGPEGGFSARETEALSELENVYPAGLGKRILRTETAAVAALSVVMYELGEI